MSTASKRLRNAAAVALAAAAFTSCGSFSPMHISDAQRSCAGGSGHREVHDTGIVVRVLGEREGRSGLHEGFIVAVPPYAPNGSQEQGVSRPYRVEDNVDITGPIPLHSGERVDVLGQFECDDSVIHWTHRDPRGRHPSGYIKANGRLYD